MLIDIWWPYPENTIFTDEACFDMLNKEIPLTIAGKQKVTGKVVYFINTPDKGGMTLRLDVDDSVRSMLF